MRPRRLVPRRRAAALSLAFALALSGRAFAEQLAAPGPSAPSPPATQPPSPAPPPAPPAPPSGGPERGSGSVPRGPGGALVQPEEQPRGAQPAAPAQITPPRPLNYVPPPYPPEAEKAGLEATVVLQLDIDREGRVKSAVVVNPAGHGFDEAALEAAKKLQFEPARRPDGSPVPARILYRYTFALKQAEPPGGPPSGKERAALAFSGTVVATGLDAPIAGATVTLGDRTATTDEQGAFRFDAVAPGKQTVTVNAPGFQPLTVEEEIAPGEQLDVKYRLAPSVEGSLEVTVRGARPPREVTRRTLEQREIARIPGTAGDALRSIQSLPGVARPPAIVGLLIVRGSAPQDSQTFVDGTIVPLIYHFGGLSSVVPTELIDKIDFYPGNFSTQYGRVMGGIVDVSLRSPKSDGFHGLVQADLVDARLLVEGPIPFLKNTTFAISGRRSYVDAWLGPVLEAAGAGVTQAPVYYDYQLLIENRPSPTSTFRVTFFGSDDALELLVREPAPGEPALTGNVGLHTGFQRLQLRYENAISNDTSFRGVVALGRDDLDFSLGPLYFLLEVFNLTGRLELSQRITQGATLNVGADVFSAWPEVALRLPPPPRPGQPPNQPFSTRNFTEIAQSDAIAMPAAYAELELVPHPRAKIVPGVRFDYYSYTETGDVSPRLNGRYDVIAGFPRTTVKGGVGVFHQPPLFQEAIEPLGTSGLDSNRAIHYALGVEQELTKQVEVSLEGFYKQLDRLVVSEASLSGTATLTYENEGRGYVVGSELLLKYKPDDRFFGWLAYTLSRSARVFHPGEEERLVPFDQTHILTVLGSYQLGGGWEMGARFRLVSGNLITPVVCNPAEAACDPYRSNALYHGPSGRYVPIPFSGPASERLPLFHQLDLRIDKRWRFKAWQLSAYLDIQNVYNHANSEAIAYNYDYTARQYVTGLPILPSIGIRADF